MGAARAFDTLDCKQGVGGGEMGGVWVLVQVNFEQLGLGRFGGRLTAGGKQR